MRFVSSLGTYRWGHNVGDMYGYIFWLCFYTDTGLDVADVCMYLLVSLRFYAVLCVDSSGTKLIIYPGLSRPKVTSTPAVSCGPMRCNSAQEQTQTFGQFHPSMLYALHLSIVRP